MVRTMYRYRQELAARMSDPQVMRIMEGERKLFSLRRVARVGQKDQLAKRVDQLKEELVGMNLSCVPKRSRWS